MLFFRVSVTDPCYCYSNFSEKKKQQKKPKVFTFLFEMIAEARPSLSHLAAQPPRSYSELCCLAACGLILSAVIDLSAKASGMDSWPGSHCSASGTLLETDGLLGHVHDGSGGHGCFLVRFGYHDTVKLNLRSFLVQLLLSRSQAKSTLVVKGFFSVSIVDFRSHLYMSL